MPAGPYFTTDPISLMLAADTAFAADLEGPDIVWQLELEPTQPLSLRSSLGLQARSFRVFPSIGRNKQLFQNLNEFLTTPRVDSLFPGYAKLILSPDPSTQVVLEFWAREPHTLSGRITLRNTGAENAELSARVAGVLVPLTGEQGMTITKQDFKTYLRGQSGDLTIALAMNGAPKPVISPYQALEISRLLPRAKNSPPPGAAAWHFRPPRARSGLSLPSPPIGRRKSPASKSLNRRARWRLRPRFLTGTWFSKPCGTKPTCCSAGLGILSAALPSSRNATRSARWAWRPRKETGHPPPGSPRRWKSGSSHVRFCPPRLKPRST